MVLHKNSNNEWWNFRPVLLSLSRTIEVEKKNYYGALEKAQSSLEITGWINYFVNTVLSAQIQAEDQIEFTLRKVKFFDRFTSQLNKRQLTVIRRIFDEGVKGFEGGMNANKYMGLTKISKTTATRDLQELVEKGIFKIVGGGRSSRYDLL